MTENAGQDIIIRQPEPIPVVMVETGRNNSVAVPVRQADGTPTPFGETVAAIAEEANYGGYYRVFLNGQELLLESDAPDNIEEGQRIGITSYDKVG